MHTRIVADGVAVQHAIRVVRSPGVMLGSGGGFIQNAVDALAGVRTQASRSGLRRQGQQRGNQLVALKILAPIGQ